MQRPRPARPRQACPCSCAKVTESSARAWVLARTTGGATPALRASFQRKAHRHQRSSGFRPANRCSGRGVMRSLPCCNEYARNACVTRAQMTWVPASFSSVLQQPSLKYPVSGSYEQGTSAVPNTFRAWAALGNVANVNQPGFHEAAVDGQGTRIARRKSRSGLLGPGAAPALASHLLTGKQRAAASGISRLALVQHAT